MSKKIIPLLFFLFSLIAVNFNSACYAEDIDNVKPGNAYLAHDSIRFVLLNDISVKNTVIIPKNTVLSATVTKAHGSRIFGQRGLIRLRLNDYKINSVHTLHFNDDFNFRGGRNYANMAASVIVPFSGLLFKGKEVNYPAGTVIEYELDDNLDLGMKEAELLAICTQ